MNLANANAIIRPAYKRAIDLILDHFKQMGITPLVGLELEFYAFVKEYGKEFLDRVILDEVLDYLKTKIEGRAHLFDRLCVENVSHAYELVTLPGTVNEIIKFGEQAKTLLLTDLVKMGWADKVSFSAKEAIWDGEYSYFRTKAMHCGISLHYDNGNIFSGANSGKGQPIIAASFAQNMLASLHELSLLIFPYDSSYDRVISKGKFAAEFQVNENGDGITKTGSGVAVRNGANLDNCYIENRLIGSDVQVYKTVFITLFAAYDSYLKLMQPEEGIIVPRNVPATLKESVEVFQNGEILKSRLNALECGLGDRIHEAELVRANAYIASPNKTGYITLDFQAANSMGL
jgi:hypothetical protein